MAELRSGDGLEALCSAFEVRWLRDAPQVRHRREAGSLMSADLSGFTALSERLAEQGRVGAERLTAMINSCFTALIDVAGRESGDVLKFGGDALLIWFHGDEHALRCARAAARMQKAIGAARFSRAGLRMSVGAHSDTFDFFLVGRPDWRELIVAGPPVTTTVDLEAAADAGEVLVSGALAAQIPDAWLVASAGGRGASRMRQLDLDGVPRPRRPRFAPDPVPIELAECLVPPGLRADVRALERVGGEHRLVTTAFLEVEGTDAVLAGGGTERITEGLDALVRSAQDLSERYGVQFLYTDVIHDGVKLLTTAGAPTSGGEDEEAALRLALDLVQGDPRRRLRAGVNRGRVFAGFLGSDLRRTYTVMGDPVNLAARLMARAEPGMVVAEADVLTRTRARFVTTSLPRFHVKGKSAPVLAHAIEAVTDEQRARRTDALPLVGRDEELAILQDAVASAAAGRGQVVELVGDAGIGKTRLLEAIRDDPRVVQLAATECQPYDTLTPYASVRGLLRRALGIHANVAPVQAGQRLLEVARRAAPELEPWLPLVAPAVGVQLAETPESKAVADEFRTARMHDTVSRLLGAILTSTSMLVVEDIYYVDDASLRLLQALATRVGEHPWMLAVTRRPAGPGLVVGEVPGTLVKLQPLPAEAAASLAEAALGDDRLAAGDLRAVAERSGGNPLFALQLVDAAVAGVAEDELPETIERLVASRFDRLDAVDRTVLRHAAVIGRVFDLHLLDALMAAETLPAVGRERWAALADLVEPDDGDRMRFRHALYRDVAYEGLPFARRRRMHQTVGELLEAGVAGEPDLGLLSEHFWLAGDAGQTWRYSVAAGDAAWASFAISEAIAAYRRALEVRRRLRGLEPAALARVAESLGDVLERAGRYDDAEGAYRLARSLVRSGYAPDQARLLRKAAVVKERMGRYDPAIRLLMRALRMLSDDDENHLAEIPHIELTLAAARHRQGRHSEMNRWAEQADKHAMLVGDVWASARAHDLMQVAVSHGVGRAGDDHGTTALELFRAAGDVHREGFALINLGVEAQLRGRWPEASERYALATEALERAGDISFASVAASNLAEILLEQGHLERAGSLLVEVRKAWEAAAYGVGIAVVLLNQGRLAALLEQWPESRRLLGEARERFDEMGSASYVIETDVRRAEALAWERRPDEATEVLDEASDPARGAEWFPYSRVAASRVRGMIAAQGSQWDEAVVLFTKAAGEAGRENLLHEECLNLTALGIVQARLGVNGPREVVERASAIAASLGIVAMPPVPLPAANL